MGNFISVHNLVKCYGDLKVLSDISFEISKGELVTFLGPSGSGKSTLLKCITRVDHNFSGNISINGQEHSQFLTHNRIATVTQKYGNFPWLSVKENIELGFKARTSNKTKKDLPSLIKSLELDGFEDYYPSQLSGGMQQRVAIGRAVAQDTEILAMDEPFGALDYLTRRKLQEFLKHTQHEFSKTVLFVTHDIEEAIYISDRVIVLSSNPCTIKNIYRIPKTVSSVDNKEVRFSENFIKLRKKIEHEFENGN